MRLLIVNPQSIHHKNAESIQKYTNLQITYAHQVNEIYQMDLSKYDIVFSPCDPINTGMYPNVKFVFGPHFSVFPEEHKMKLLIGNNMIYIQPSEWAVSACTTAKLSYTPNNVRFMVVPFGVDTEKYNSVNPLTKRTKVFVYCKSRNPDDYNKVFHYQRRYSGEEYLEYLHQAKYGIWIDGHESQGFALQEALSCNIPLLVWNVSSMNQEYGQSYDDIPATTIPYWDVRCGEYFYEFKQMPDKFKQFQLNMDCQKYRPREYILENLSVAVCEQRFMKMCKMI